MRKSRGTRSALALAGLAGLYGAAASANPVISSFYLSGQIAADSGFTTGVQNISISNTSPTVFVPEGDYFQFGVSAVITNNPNSTAGDAWDMANQAKGNPAQPANLGLVEASYQVGSTDTNGSILPPVEGATTGTTVDGQTDYYSTAVIANTPTDAFQSPGDVISGNGTVGISQPVFFGMFLTLANPTTAAGVASLGFLAGTSNTPAAAGAVFTDLAYHSVSSGLVGLEPSLLPVDTYYFIPKTSGTVDGSGNITSNATYTQQVANNAATINSMPVLAVYTAPAIVWDGQAGQTSWDTSSTNWSDNGTPGSKFSGNDLVTFDDSAPSNATSIMLNTAVSPYEVTANSNTNNYSITGSGSISAISLVKEGGSTLTLATNNTISGSTTISGGVLQVGNGGSNGSLGSAAITDNSSLVFDLSSSASVSNSISGTGSVAQSGTGTVTLSGANSYSGGTTVNSGTLVVNAAGALPAGGALAVNGSSVVKLATGTGGETLSSLTVATNATLNVGNNHIILNYIGSDPASSILLALKSGSHGGLWNGDGITSTASGIGNGYGVGFVDGASGINSTLSSGQIEIAYALDGDANLDGRVDVSDFNIVAPNFGLPVSGGWEDGDFDYGGVVDITDFNLFSANFGLQANGTSIDLPASDWAALNAFTAEDGLTTDVPEPFSAGLMVLGGAILLGRRSRRKSARFLV